MDHDGMVELHLFVENTAELYPMKKAIIKNLKRKIEKGVYDAAKARVA